MFTVAGQPEGAIRADGRVMGSYLHGMSFQEQPAGRQVADRQYNPNLTLRECGLSEAD
jgi:cobyric acid synthase